MYLVPYHYDITHQHIPLLHILAIGHVSYDEIFWNSQPYSVIEDLTSDFNEYFREFQLKIAWWECC